MYNNILYINEMVKDVSAGAAAAELLMMMIMVRKQPSFILLHSHENAIIMKMRNKVNFNATLHRSSSNASLPFYSTIHTVCLDIISNHQHPNECVAGATEFIRQ